MRLQRPIRPVKPKKPGGTMIRSNIKASLPPVEDFHVDVL